MTSPVEILKSHAIDHFFTADEGRFVECTCTEHVFISEHPGHVAAALEEARREAYEVTEQWGLEYYGAILPGGVGDVGKRYALAEKADIECHGKECELVSRTRLVGPWQPSASEEG